MSGTAPSGRQLKLANRNAGTLTGTARLQLAPLCRVAYDTPGHIAASCSHPQMKSCYISRHNHAVRRVQRAVAQGSLGHSYMIMDATSAAARPAGVAATRLPPWMLPALALDLRDKFRPC